MNASIEVVPLGDAVNPTRPRVKPADFSELPFIGMEHIEAHSMKLLGTVPAGTMKSSAVHFKPGDVLYGRLRPYLNKIYRPSFEGLCSAEFIVLPENERVDGAYLQYFLNSAAFVQYATHLNAGDRPRVDFDQIAPYGIPLPRKDEQRRIAQEIEKQFSRLDEAIANLKRANANLMRYKAAVLRDAFEGCLSDTHSGSLGSWTPSTLNQIARIIGGLTKNPKRAALPRQLPYLRVANVYANELRLDDIERIGVADSELEKLLLKAGDLLIVEGNGSKDQIGRLAIWDGSIDPCVHQNHLIKVRLSERVLPKWVLFWLLSPRGRKHIEEVSSSTSGLYTLSINKVAALPVAVPSLEEQRQIVAEVERRLEIVSGVDSAIEKNFRRAKRFRRAIFEKCFRSNTAR